MQDKSHWIQIILRDDLNQKYTLDLDPDSTVGDTIAFFQSHFNLNYGTIQLRDHMGSPMDKSKTFNDYGVRNMDFVEFFYDN